MKNNHQQDKFAIGAPMRAIAASVILLAGSISSANAGHYNGHQGSGLGAILGGAAVGAVIGGAVKGGKGAAVGAGVGAVVGAAASSGSRAGPPPPPPPPRPYHPPRPVYDQGLVYNIQASLSRLGYNPGPLDGAYGQLTADAISSYEYNNQIAVTGIPTEGLYYHMKQAGG